MLKFILSEILSFIYIKLSYIINYDYKKICCKMDLYHDIEFIKEGVKKDVYKCKNCNLTFYEDKELTEINYG